MLSGTCPALRLLALSLAARLAPTAALWMLLSRWEFLTAVGARAAALPKTV